MAVLGPVPGGLPSFGLPNVDWSQDVPALAATAFSIFIVVLAQSAATSRAYAAKYGDRFDENVDLVGLGMASAAAGVSGTFVVNGSPTKTQMVDGAGGRSQLASLTCAGIVLIVLLFLTKPLQYMPEAVLSTVVFLIGIELIAIKGMRKILRLRVDEFVVAAITAAVVVSSASSRASCSRSCSRSSTISAAATGPTTRSSSARPRVASLPCPSSRPRRRPRRRRLPLRREPLLRERERFAEEVRQLVAGAEPPVKQLCLDAEAIGDVDYSGGRDDPGDGDRSARRRECRSPSRGRPTTCAAELDRYGLTELIGADAIYDTVEAALTALTRGRG